jgi:hypothetical protein
MHLRSATSALREGGTARHVRRRAALHHISPMAQNMLEFVDTVLPRP